MTHWLILSRPCFYLWPISLGYIKRRTNKRSFSIASIRTGEGRNSGEKKNGISPLKMGDMGNSLFEFDNGGGSLRKETGNYPRGSSRETLRTPWIRLTGMHPRQQILSRGTWELYTLGASKWVKLKINTLINLYINTHSGSIMFIFQFELLSSELWEIRFFYIYYTYVYFLSLYLLILINFHRSMNQLAWRWCNFFIIIHVLGWHFGLNPQMYIAVW